LNRQGILDFPKSKVPPCEHAMVSHAHQVAGDMPDGNHVLLTAGTICLANVPDVISNWPNVGNISIPVATGIMEQ
jgi:hypothetical protein